MDQFSIANIQGKMETLGSLKSKVGIRKVLGANVPSIEGLLSADFEKQDLGSPVSVNGEAERLFSLM